MQWQGPWQNSKQDMEEVEGGCLLEAAPWPWQGPWHEKQDMEEVEGGCL